MTIDGNLHSSIGGGLMVLVGVVVGDTEQDAEWLAAKTAALRIFDDENGVPNRSVVDIGGAILLISQFTLLGDARKGRRPSYIFAARPETAIPLYERCIESLKRAVPVETGRFGAEMKVSILNDGPFTILLDSKKGF